MKTTAPNRHQASEVPASRSTRALIHIRRSRITDLPALRRIARLQERELPNGMFLVAEMEGSIIAAAALEEDAPPLAEQRRPYSDQLKNLLESQASFVRSAGRRPHLILLSAGINACAQLRRGQRVGDAAGKHS